MGWEFLVRKINGEQDLDDARSSTNAAGQKVWFYTDCPEADRTDRETHPSTNLEDDNGDQADNGANDSSVDNAGDQADDKAGGNTDDQASDKTSNNDDDITDSNTDDGQNVDLVNVCFEVTRTNSPNSQTVHPQKLLLHKGLVETGLEMFDNDNPKTTCIEVWPHVMPRITFSSSDGVSFEFERYYK